MNRVSLLFLFLLFCGCYNQNSSKDTKNLLIEQLKNSHINKDWYVPLNYAVKNLTIEQVHWQDSTQNHSICQLVSHLIFWNERILIAFHGKTPPEFDNVNDETFLEYCSDDWPGMISKLDSIQIAWEDAVENASDAQLIEWGSSIANIASHNAYHTGQIVYIRKKNNWWDNSLGVQ